MPHRASGCGVGTPGLHGPDKHKFRLYRSVFPPRLGLRSFAPRCSPSFSDPSRLSADTSVSRAPVLTAARSCNIPVTLLCLYFSPLHRYCTDDESLEGDSCEVKP